eukprot:TRINITY_DN51135_c0_g1_i1.p1 TRINITY_DN51135_c0_g1~~TRINITY_DN51135_c0_g1_i1.p1  ORF type:complete len:283 (-),score=45.59 TRINITY_DN51135_c0_g1_i1:31-855(-)
MPGESQRLARLAAPRSERSALKQRGRSLGSRTAASTDSVPAALPPPARLTCWQGLPTMDDIAFCPEPITAAVALGTSEEQYCREADALLAGFPEVTWRREGKPDKVSLGPRSTPEDWAKYSATCPHILEAAEKLLRSFRGQHVEVTFGDVLDYRAGNLLGWHQDNMDLTRHTFTVVLTLSSNGDGRFEWRQIADDGRELGEVVSSATPSHGNLAIHGLTCNNKLAHRAYWEEGRRVALVLFCRSEEVERALTTQGVQSCITMRHWWSKDFELVK